MSMTTRDLRLALQQKLGHRRELMAENTFLRDDVRRERSRNEFLLSTLSNPLVDMVLEECADRIMGAIVREAVKASRVVADETMDGGSYEIGISVPSLHIRHRLLKADLFSADVDRSVKRVSVGSGRF